MISTDFFYRSIGTADFVQDAAAFSLPRIPVRLKQKYVAETVFFCPKHNAWEAVEALEQKRIVGKNGEVYDALPFELVVKPEYPSTGSLGCVESMDEEGIRRLLKVQDAARAYSYHVQYFADENDIPRAYFAFSCSCDDEKLTVTIKSYSFLLNAMDTLPEKIEPQEEVYSFNVADGDFQFLLPEEEPDFIDEFDDDDNHVAKRFNWIQTVLSGKKLPQCVLQFAFERLASYARKFTGIELLLPYPEARSKVLPFMHCIAMLPTEPNLYAVITNSAFSGFRYKRTDAELYNRFCKKYRIKSYRQLRVLYAERPEVLVSYLHIKSCGFKDINIYNQVLESAERCVAFFDNALRARKELVFFAKYSIKRRGELATMHGLLRDFDREHWIASDAIDMFCKYFRHIPETLKKDILKDGLTEFNHDALSNLSYKCQNKKITFSYTPAQTALQDCIGGYEFRLPVNSYELCEIGSRLHNCVASYADSVVGGRCTIVVAYASGAPVICIEVRGRKVCQQRTNYNNSLDDAQLQVLSQWKEKHQLQ